MQSKWKFTWGGPIPRQQIVAQFVCCPKHCRIWNLIKYFFSIVQCNTPPCNLCQMLCSICQSGSLLSLSLVAVLRVLLAIPLHSITPMCSYNCKIAMLINVVRQVAVKIAQCKEKGNSKNKGSFSHASVVIWSFLFQYLQQSLGVCAKPVFHSLTLFFFNIKLSGLWLCGFSQDPSVLLRPRQLWGLFTLPFILISLGSIRNNGLVKPHPSLACQANIL